MTTKDEKIDINEEKKGIEEKKIAEGPKIKTVSQIVEEYINRQNPKIKALVIEASGRDRSTYCYHEVSNLHKGSDIDGTFFEFDVPGRHVKIYGRMILRDEVI